MPKGAKASKRARGRAALEHGSDPDEVFGYLMDRFWNGRMSDDDRTELALKILPFIRPRKRAISVDATVAAETTVRIVIGGDAN